MASVARSSSTSSACTESSTCNVLASAAIPNAPSNALSVAFAAFLSVSSVSIIDSILSSVISAGIDCPGKGTEGIETSSGRGETCSTSGNFVDCSTCWVTFGASFLIAAGASMIALDKSMDEPANTEIGRVWPITSKDASNSSEISVSVTTFDSTFIISSLIVK